MEVGSIVKSLAGREKNKLNIVKLVKQIKYKLKNKKHIFEVEIKKSLKSFKNSEKNKKN